MQSEHTDIGWRFWGRWVLVTTVGWSIGMIAAFIAGHIVNIAYPKETNLVVGLCLGAVIGYMQRRFAPNPITTSQWWVLSTSVGMGIPFIIVVIADEFWGGIPLGLALIVAVGGLLTGLLQLGDVRRHSTRSAWWVLASIVGWGLGWLVMDLVFGVGLFLGGALLGAVTGAAVVWLLHSPPSTEQDAGVALSAAGTASST